MKQRLVGTLVLGSLALIVIPLLLDGEGVERPPLSATIPPAPVFDTTPLPDPIRPEIIDDSLMPAVSPLDPETAVVPDALDAAVQEVLAEATAAVDASTDTEIEIEPEAAPVEGTAPVEAEEAEEVAIAESAPEAAPAQSTSTPALAASGLPEGWIVRLGAFSNRANADALVTRLVTAGHKAYIRPVMSGDVALSGVFVGPVPTRNEASTLQNELKSRFQINDAIVQRYDISQ